MYIIYTVLMQSFKTKQYNPLFIDTYVYRTMRNRKLHFKCIMIVSVWMRNKTGKRSQKCFQLYSVSFLLFKNITKSSQILNICTG